MSTSRVHKIISVSDMLHQSPYDSLYSSKKPYRANEQLLVDKHKVDIYNSMIDEVLKYIPYNKQFQFLKNIFIELGLRED